MLPIHSFEILRPLHAINNPFIILIISRIIFLNKFAFKKIPKQMQISLFMNFKLDFST